MHPIAITYQSLLNEMPGELRIRASTLPFEIGITASLNGGWEDYCGQAPMYGLPLFVLPDDQSISENRVALFCAAHHCAGFFGLLSDRIADHQTKSDDIFIQFQVFFKTVWIRYLSRATGNPETLISERINSAISKWKEGILLERSLFKPGSMEPESYSRAILQKVSWLKLTSVCLLETLGCEENLKSFLNIWDLMICGMQCRDDACDFEEDKKLFGINYPEALGVTPGALYRCGCTLLKESYLIARQTRFKKLVSWLKDHANSHFKCSFKQYPELDAFGGRIFSSEISEIIQRSHHQVIEPNKLNSPVIPAL